MTRCRNLSKKLKQSFSIQKLDSAICHSSTEVVTMWWWWTSNDISMSFLPQQKSYVAYR